MTHEEHLKIHAQAVKQMASPAQSLTGIQNHINDMFDKVIAHMLQHMHEREKEFYKQLGDL